MVISPARRNALFVLALSATILNLVDRQIIAVLKPMIATDLHWNDDDAPLPAPRHPPGEAVEIDDV